MPRADLGQIILDAFDKLLEESPDPWRNSYLWEDFWGDTKTSYRDRLTSPLLNYKGIAIPRIVLVRQNLHYLGDNRTVRPLP